MGAVGFGLNISSSPATDAVAEARNAEALGFDLVTVHPDHPPATGRHGTAPSLEAWGLLAWIAARTTSVTLAPCVLSLPFRHPALVAKMAETFDRLSGRRLVLGLGAGGDDEATRAFGLEVLQGHQKVEALEEAIDVIRGLWTTAEFTMHGRHFRLEAASIEPRPSRPIPIWVGAYGPQMLDLVGRKADGWLPTLHYLVHVLGREPSALEGMLARVRRAAVDAGRDPDDITYACNVQVLIDGDLGPRRGQVTGGAEEVTRQLQKLIGLGFTFINVWPVGDSASLPSQLAQDVIPVLRGVSAY
ncbi:MAG: LLM class flavin-dependent oxidoreductase [Acidimicrobiales bacterium]